MSAQTNPMPITSGQLLYRLRTQEGLTITDLAMRIKTSRPYLSSVESDQQRMSREIAERLAIVFHLPPWELMYPGGWQEHRPEGW